MAYIPGGPTRESTYRPGVPGKKQGGFHGQRLPSFVKPQVPLVVPRHGELGQPPKGPVHLDPEQMDRFLWGEKLNVTSTLLAAAQYDMAKQELILWFLDGASALYYGVTPQEARSFADAPSKGIWFWDNIRVRGSAVAHHKDYVVLT